MKLRPLAYALILLALPALSQAQSPYSAAVKVNGSAVSYFEIEQRTLMLEVLGTIGDVEKQAVSDLIDDRLKQQAARAFGLKILDDERALGMKEFSQRANMVPEQFIDALAQAGIYPETFSDFVSVGLLWRKVIQLKFQSKAFITEAELDTAIALGSTSLGASVLMSELVLPFDETTKAETRELAVDLRKDIHGFTDFEDAVITYSAAASRAKGGKLDWVPVGNLPKEIATLIMTMGVGQVTPPIAMPNAYTMFQLRGIRDNRTVVSRTIAYDYATLNLPGGRSQQTLQVAANLAGSIDTCNDLAAKSKKYPPENYSRTVVPFNQVPKHIALELAKLDANEVSTNLTQGDSGQFLTFLMLCGRTTKLSEGDRGQVREALFNQRMEAFGVGYLQELMGDAVITGR